MKISPVFLRYSESVLMISPTYISWISPLPAGVGAEIAECFPVTYQRQREKFLLIHELLRVAGLTHIRYRCGTVRAPQTAEVSPRYGHAVVAAFISR